MYCTVYAYYAVHTLHTVNTCSTHGTYSTHSTHSTYCMHSTYSTHSMSYYNHPVCLFVCLFVYKCLWFTCNHCRTRPMSLVASVECHIGIGVCLRILTEPYVLCCIEFCCLSICIILCVFRRKSHNLITSVM